MDAETKLLILAQVPYVIGLFLITSSNIMETGKPVVSRILYILSIITFWLFFFIWLIGGQLNLFSEYLGVTDRLAWGYFMVAIFIKTFMFSNKGKIITHASKNSNKSVKQTG